MTDSNFALDLFAMSSLCARSHMRVRNIAMLTLLWRKPGLSSRQAAKLSGLPVSDSYTALYFLERKGIVKRSYNAAARFYSWDLTTYGKSVIIEFERIYRQIHQLMKKSF